MTTRPLMILCVGLLLQCSMAPKDQVQFVRKLKFK